MSKCKTRQLTATRRTEDRATARSQGNQCQRQQDAVVQSSSNLDDEIDLPGAPSAAELPAGPARVAAQRPAEDGRDEQGGGKGAGHAWPTAATTAPPPPMRAQGPGQRTRVPNGTPRPQDPRPYQQPHAIQLHSTGSDSRGAGAAVGALHDSETARKARPRRQVGQAAPQITRQGKKSDRNPPASTTAIGHSDNAAKEARAAPRNRLDAPRPPADVMRHAIPA